MNTRKQVLIMSGLLLMMLVIVAVYAAWYPSRATDAEDHFEEARAERGSLIFARNCRTCHGDVGEGGALGGRLPAAPALNRPDLQGFEDSTATLTAEVNPTAGAIEVSDGGQFAPADVILIDEERMEVSGVDGNTVEVERGFGHTEAAAHFANAKIWTFDEALLEDALDLITNTIACGRVGTAMPAWSQDQGSSLSDEQIEQLAVLITTARWDLVKHEVDIEDAISAELTAPVPADATEIMVSDITRFNVDSAIRLGDERLRITAIPEYPATATNIPGALTVERAIYDTFAEEHSQDTEIFSFPEAPDPPSINEASCGQIAGGAPADSGPCEVTNGSVQISAEGLAFSCDEIEVDAGSEVNVDFTNLEATPHNIAFYVSESDTTPVADGSVGNVFPGPDVTQTVTFDAPTAGDYFFRCDVHPTQMTGTFVVN